MSQQTDAGGLHPGVSGSNRVWLVKRPWWKRPADVVLSVVAMLVLAPVAVLIAVLIRFRLGSPVLFRQQRGGLGGSEFEILKFRTMTNERGSDGELLSNDERRHAFGESLRKSSLDELPALLNVARGEMSMVGPRPLMAVYLQRYSPEQAQRHAVRPGITGLAQVKGRNRVTWEEKFELDLAYITDLGFIRDAKILLQTAQAVFRSAEADGNELTTEFR